MGFWQIFLILLSNKSRILAERYFKRWKGAGLMIRRKRGGGVGLADVLERIDVVDENTVAVITRLPDGGKTRSTISRHPIFKSIKEIQERVREMEKKNRGER